MLIYPLVFLLILLACIFITEQKGKTITVIIICSFLLFFSGLRGNIDGDYWAYIDMYEASISSSGLGPSSIETSFVLLSKLAKITVGSFNGVLMVYSFLSLSLLGYVIIKLGKSNLYILLCYYSFYFFLHPMTQMRAAVAASAVLLCIRFIYKKQLWRFVATLSLASVFHVSAVMFLPFYFIANRFELTINRSCIIVIVSIVIVKVLHPMSLIGMLPLNPDYYIFSKIIMHEQTLEGGVGARTADVYFIMALLKLVFNIFMQTRREHLSQYSEYFDLYLRVHFIAYISYILLSDMHIVAGRVSELLGIVEIMLLPLLAFVFKPVYVGKTVLVLIILFQFIISIYVVGLVRPYMFGSIL